LRYVVFWKLAAVGGPALSFVIELPNLFPERRSGPKLSRQSFLLSEFRKEYAAIFSFRDSP